MRSWSLVNGIELSCLNMRDIDKNTGRPTLCRWNLFTMIRSIYLLSARPQNKSRRSLRLNINEATLAVTTVTVAQRMHWRRQQMNNKRPERHRCYSRLCMATRDWTKCQSILRFVCSGLCRQFDVSVHGGHRCQRVFACVYLRDTVSGTSGLFRQLQWTKDERRKNKKLLIWYWQLATANCKVLQKVRNVG